MLTSSTTSAFINFPAYPRVPREHRTRRGHATAALLQVPVIGRDTRFAPAISPAASDDVPQGLTGLCRGSVERVHAVAVCFDVDDGGPAYSWGGAELRTCHGACRAWILRDGVCSVPQIPHVAIVVATVLAAGGAGAWLCCRSAIGQFSGPAGRCRAARHASAEAIPDFARRLGSVGL